MMMNFFKIATSSILLLHLFSFNFSLAQRKNAAPEYENVYACPMHSDVRSSIKGLCPKCGMPLSPTLTENKGDYLLKLECSPSKIIPNQKLHLKFTVFNPSSAQQVKEFTVTHEQLLHLFVVSQDMQHFQHIHPTLNKESAFIIDTILPRPGNYKLFADFYPANGTPQVIQKNLTTAGYQASIFRSKAQLTPDKTLTKIEDNTKIQLKIEPAEVIAGKPIALKYHLTDIKTGEPVNDLIPYLGAWGHTLILSEDLSDYIHSHPSEPVKSTNGNLHKGGPYITFDALLPRPGNYRIWTQFQRGNLLTTVHFTVKAVRLH
jgi:hypothetical protein